MKFVGLSWDGVLLPFSPEARLMGVSLLRGYRL
jgi:hypothetical protein